MEYTTVNQKMSLTYTFLKIKLKRIFNKLLKYFQTI